MPRKIALAALCAALCGCAYQPEVTAMFGPRRSEGATDVAATIMLIQRVGRRAVVGCVHQSEPQHGAPWNDDDETTGDTCGFGARWGGNARR